MEKNVNVIVMEGRCTKDLELKYTNEGLAYTHFDIANNGFKLENGNMTEEVNYFSVNTWGKLAEICASYLKKGSKIIISGRIKQSNWKDEKGNNRSKVQIVAQDVKFLSSNR